jgi:hypothetical protein
MSSAARALRNGNSNVVISFLTYERFGKYLFGVIHRNETLYFSERDPVENNHTDLEKSTSVKANNYNNETFYMIQHTNLTGFDLLVIDRQTIRFVRFNLSYLVLH